MKVLEVYVKQKFSLHYFKEHFLMMENVVDYTSMSHYVRDIFHFQRDANEKNYKVKNSDTVV